MVLGRTDRQRRLSSAGWPDGSGWLQAAQVLPAGARAHVAGAGARPRLDQGGNEASMTSPLPKNAMDELEARAAEQRQRLHNNVIELRRTVKQRLDVKRNVRDHLGLAALVMAVIGLTLGYMTAGIFTRRYTICHAPGVGHELEEL